MEKNDLPGLIRLAPDNYTDNQWGGRWIPAFKGLRAPKGPVGEAWEFSAHRDHPSALPGLRENLSELISRRADDVLGRRARLRFGGQAPFLLKFIDSRDDLSVQVHPGDDYARAKENDSGKAESWIVLDVARGAADGFIYLGFNPKKAEGYAGLSDFRDAFFAALDQANGQGPSDDPRIREKAARVVLPFLNRVRVRPGQVYDVPPGTVHAIGRGVRLFEIQQTSNVTYRVWDWNRVDEKARAQGRAQFRPLHLAQARDVLDFRPRAAEDYSPPQELAADDGSGGFEVRLTANAEGIFAANELTLKSGARWEERAEDSFRVLTIVEGAADVAPIEGGRALRLRRGHSVLVTAAAGGYRARAVGKARLIKSFVP